jgi:hypothetical protein
MAKSLRLFFLSNARKLLLLARPSVFRNLFEFGAENCRGGLQSCPEGKFADFLLCFELKSSECVSLLLLSVPGNTLLITFLISALRFVLQIVKSMAYWNRFWFTVVVICFEKVERRSFILATDVNLINLQFIWTRKVELLVGSLSFILSKAFRWLSTVFSSKKISSF